MNKENTVNLAIKCESPLSPQARRLRLKRPYFNEEDCSRPKICKDNEYQKYGNEENEDLMRRSYQRQTNRSEICFGKDHLRVLRNQYYFSPRWRQNVPFRNLADKNGNNLLMIAPAQSEKDDVKSNGQSCKEKEGKEGGAK